MTAQLLRGVPHQVYHADDLPGSPHFSRGVAVRILSQSALHAFQAHPKLGGTLEDEPTEALDKGSLVHELLLGGGPEVVAVYVHSNKAKLGPLVPALDWRKDEAQEIREAVRAEGKLPVLPHLLDECMVAAASIRTRLLDFGLVLGDKDEAGELTALWEDGGTPCKARLDFYPGGDTVFDLKVQRNLAVSQFEFTVKRFGLDIQAHAYASAVAAARPPLAGRMGFEWILVERKPPYDVALIPASKSILGLGQSRWNRALKVWRECMTTGRWPGMGRLTPVEARPYDLEQELVAAVASVGEPDWMKGGD